MNDINNLEEDDDEASLDDTTINENDYIGCILVMMN